MNALIHRDYLELGSEVHVDMFDDRMEIYSPGGMVDGTFIQNLNLEQVPSKRRNPVLADVFARLDYMERNGSGIGKIIDACEFAVNYTDKKAPVFYSDRAQFRVTLSNLNYGLSGDEEYEIDQTSQRLEEYKRRTEEVFLNTMRKNPNITGKELAKMLGISEDGVKYHLRKLKNKGLIERVGSARGGHWKVL